MAKGVSIGKTGDSKIETTEDSQDAKKGCCGGHSKSGCCGGGCKCGGNCNC